MPQNASEPQVWAELPASEVLALLKRIAAEHGGVVLSGFLDTHQWAPLQATPGLAISGGHAVAQYRRAALGGEIPGTAIWHSVAGELPEGVRSARQLRAWLYRAGLPGSSTGDIVMDDGAVLVLTPEVDPATVGLIAARLDAWPLPTSPAKRRTAASARMDAVVASVFSVSRGEARTAIEYGFVFCNLQPVKKRTQAVRPGDQLVYRTKGRAQIVELAENRRSGRLWVEYRLFPG